MQTMKVNPEIKNDATSMQRLNNKKEVIRIDSARLSDQQTAWKTEYNEVCTRYVDLQD